ncbi:hypothetical protein FACS1894178_3070 [Bacteroidia bacterium]|nr:hypothetical protein FACS1894178_3070 [Bacteroidia bacterium]
MKKIIILTALCVLHSALCTSNAQSKNFNPADDIAISVYVPQPIEGLPDIAVANLENKLNQIAVQNGLGAIPGQRFVLTTNLTVVNKDLTASAPPMHAYTIEVSLYIADGTEGKLFSTTSFNIKGVGETETKAYMSALRNIKTKNPAYADFLAEGKTKIVDYYNRNCDLILREAETLANMNNYEGAFAKLVSIPSVCTECYNKVLTAALPIYKKMIDRDCKIKLNAAIGIWTAAQDYRSASDAAEILSQIEPEAACFGEVKTLFGEISKRVREIDAREWNYILKDQNQKSEWIQAWRDVGVAYGTHQPNLEYHLKTLW